MGGGIGLGGAETRKVPSIRDVGYDAVVMCGEKLCYGGTHVAGGDDGDGCVERHFFGGVFKEGFGIWWVSVLELGDGS